MRTLFTALFLALPICAVAQETPPQDDIEGKVISNLPRPESLPKPQTDQPGTTLRLKRDGEWIDIPSPNSQIEPQIDPGLTPIPEVDVAEEDVVPENLEPDYSKLSPSAERLARLDDLFVKLAEKEDAEGANLVAEEIMAFWMDSGSASVNLLLRRGATAEAQGDPTLARTMYNHAVDLSPDFTEAWARSARLALTQKKYNRALNESLKTLALEPRHFYTLWTMGNVLEVLNRQDEALEAYREANRLYPELKAVKDRVEALDDEVNGTVF